MRHYLALFSLVICALPFMGCASITDSAAFYATPTGMEPKNEFTRLYIHNQCYEDVRVTFPKEWSGYKDKQRSHFIAGRDMAAVWIRERDSLPLLVAGREDAPDLTYTPEEIRGKSTRDVWHTGTAFIESYTLPLCPKEPPLRDDEKNMVRPAVPGEMVDVYAYTFVDVSDRQGETVVIALNGKRVRNLEMVLKTDTKFEVAFLLPSGTTGELTVYNRLIHDGNGKRTLRIGETWIPRVTRPAVKGELVTVEPQPVTPKGSWE